jgi:hypothetical protein
MDDLAGHNRLINNKLMDLTASTNYISEKIHFIDRNKYEIDNILYTING